MCFRAIEDEARRAKRGGDKIAERIRRRRGEHDPVVPNPEASQDEPAEPPERIKYPRGKWPRKPKEKETTKSEEEPPRKPKEKKTKSEEEPPRKKYPRGMWPRKPKNPPTVVSDDVVEEGEDGGKPISSTTKTEDDEEERMIEDEDGGGEGDTIPTKYEKTEREPITPKRGRGGRGRGGRGRGGRPRQVTTKIELVDDSPIMNDNPLALVPVGLGTSPEKITPVPVAVTYYEELQELQKQAKTAKRGEMPIGERIRARRKTM